MSLSPPPAPLSLPPSNYNQPKKRPSGLPPSASAISHKKPRMHPLRQTSFPASQDTDPRVYSASAISVKSEADGGSVTGSFTGSFGGGSADGVMGNVKGKKRKKGGGTAGSAAGRKGGEREREGPGSVRGTVVDGGAESLGNEEGDVEEGEEEGDEGDLDEEGERDRDGAAREAEAERKNLAILIDAFTPAQSSRYDFFKRAKLNKPMVRKIVNQTLSQSVPPNVITTISGYTKVFVGELVEKARTVQEEWAEAADRAAYAEYAAALAKEEEEEDEDEEEVRAKSEAEAATATSTQSKATNTILDTQAQTRTFESGSSATEAGLPSIIKTEPKENGMAAVKEEPSSASGIKTNGATLTQSTTTPPSSAQTQPPSQSQTDTKVHTPTASQSFTPTVPNSTSTSPQSQPTPKSKKQKPPFKPPPNPHRGQLLPAHLREALRRYKRDGEGGGVGLGGLSMGGTGVKGSFSCGVRGVGGRRLFR
ncbi:transcription initiation factor TFIID subunit 11 [[Emmonsia] crescens]|uniref:Transcription initiation factor TFIID subunit 11 n=1 Tax=[Emmonsia] crescens TaxID=73230 RepID=A0A2B7Z6M0_9EURO|nr:transcription initiation factor TFIID subunit 11 [Emmonsia crescens]